MKFSARLAALLVVTAFTFGNVHAAGDLAPLQVFTDPQLDQPVLLEATPPYQDLVAGYISETATDITFTWEVVDIPDPLEDGVPNISTYYWEFTLDVPDDGIDPVPFSVRATPDRAGGTGSLESTPCTTENNLLECTPVNARVTVAIDAAANTVSATLRRKDLRSNGAQAGGTIIAVDGAELDEIDLFQGIAAFTSLVAVVPGSTADPADLDDIYILGTPR